VLVSVGVKVPVGVFVLVGVAVGVLVFVGVTVSVGVLLVGVSVGVSVSVGTRVLVGVFVPVGVEVGTGEAVSLGGITRGVDPDCAWYAACTVKAAAVFRFEIAKSMMLAGSRTMGVAWLGLESAIVDVIHNKLMPRRPAATTPRRLV
jgi:hypothetical protein